MVKHQVHDEFQSFTGTSILELSKTAADFAVQKQVAVKSLSVVMLPTKIILSLGYRSDEAQYPIAVEGATLPATGDLNDNLEYAAENIGGDVICHSLYMNRTGELEVAFLLHE